MPLIIIVSNKHTHWFLHHKELYSITPNALFIAWRDLIFCFRFFYFHRFVTPFAKQLVVFFCLCQHIQHVEEFSESRAIASTIMQIRRLNVKDGFIWFQFLMKLFFFVIERKSLLWLQPFIAWSDFFFCIDNFPFVL